MALLILDHLPSFEVVGRAMVTHGTARCLKFTDGHLLLANSVMTCARRGDCAELIWTLGGVVRVDNFPRQAEKLVIAGLLGLPDSFAELLELSQVLGCVCARGKGRQDDYRARCHAFMSI